MTYEATEFQTKVKVVMFLISHKAASGYNAQDKVESSAPAAVSRALYVAETFGFEGDEVTISTGVASHVVARVKCGEQSIITWNN